ncbi:MAG: glycosyltransferase [Actinomycetes bacterium]|jgi:alpha-1,6-mannosyltransferase
MRIVHVANFYGPNSGGIKTTLHELGKGYLKNGHEFIYLVPGTRYRTEDTQYGKKISLPSYILPGSGGYQLIKSNRFLKAELARLAPDRLEISDRFTLISVGGWAKERSIPTVVFSHETLRGLADRFLPNYFPKRAMVNWHNRKLARAFDQVIATTEFAAQEFRDIGISNLAKVPLGVDLQNFLPSNRCDLMREELLKGAKYLVVHCSRLSPEKEPQRAIEAVEELIARGVSARLIVIGTGPMWHKLRHRAAGLPVDYLGYIADRKRVATILSCADVTMAPGPLETFCLSALESLASGTPVIASKSSAVGEFLHSSEINPAGAVADDNGVAFADAIELLLKQPRARESARRAAEDLPWGNSVQAMLELHGIAELGQLAPTAATKRRLTAA